MKLDLYILYILVVTTSVSCLAHKTDTHSPLTSPKSEQALIEPAETIDIGRMTASEAQNLEPIEASDQDHVTYRAYPGETLMKIAFHVYTDHSKWRKIAHANPDLFKNGYYIYSSVELKIPKPLNIHQSSEGRPYLIKPGDTLSLISRKVYGELNFWPDIWRNNKEMIQDPNLIFAGFTLYYKKSPAMGKSIQEQYSF